MSIDEKPQKGVTRRTFIKGAVLGAAGVAAGGMLAGCGVKEETKGPSPTTSNGTSKPSFLTPPDPIPDSEIKETKTADVVVVGAGCGGLIAAVSAAEAGAKTILLEKGDKPTTGAMWMAAINSSLQKKLGIEIDRDEVVAEICRYGGHLVDQRLVNLWADKSGEFMDWFMPLMEAAGYETILETDLKEGYYKSYPVGHVVIKPPKQDIGHLGDYGSPLFIPVLENKAKELGVEIYYKMPGVQLEQDNSGRVTGIIAGNSENYTRFNANKGIILCTGGYARNEEMIKELCPTAQYSGSSIAPPGNTGDGIKMAMWVGAAIDPIQAMMVFDRGLVGKDGKLGAPWKGGYLRIGSQPFLRVNINGERFVNEDLPYDFICNAGVMQPGHVWWQIWDGKWREDITRFHTTICSRVVQHPEAPPRDGLDHVEKELENFVKQGLLIKADTIDELVQKMGVPADTFKATIARYNELAKKGKDEDFGKLAFRLSTIEKAPFYAAKLSSALLCNITGLRINTKMQVLNEDLDPIPGLYAAGNDSGSFFAFSYPQMFGGLALGRIATFARLAGQYAAAE
ncbi:MAG TPA: FAD-dependent oxidoreductase [Syntrophomonadaceae bacterium]|nr:FAD-dependent oxidoreductase [Syntrophomonadaceae bacterium]